MTPLRPLCLAIGLAFTGLQPVSASPVLYPLSPAGAQVLLQPRDFVQWVPQYSTDASISPTTVVGDHIGQHPGFTGSDTAGSYFIGVFGGHLDTGNPDAALYLWETTGGGIPIASLLGPTIELGWWSGSAFYALVDYLLSATRQPVLYSGTGVAAEDPFFEINAGILRLADFGVPLGYDPGHGAALNAVRVTAAAGAHNQVTAIAATLVPEPGALLLAATATLALLTVGRRSPSR